MPEDVTPSPLVRTKQVRAAIAALAHQGNIEARGAVFTKPEVVDGILDLCGYQSERPLADLRVLEPACGAGEFLYAIIRRLLAACRRQQIPMSEWVDRLGRSVRAVELHIPTFEHTKTRLRQQLMAEGLSACAAEQLADRWLTQDDFLLTPLAGTFDVIVGNPPYVRQERIPAPLLSVYRQRFSTLYDRADLYVLFYERCLDRLADGGVLGFICANRWVKNKYGSRLRAKIADGYNLDAYIDMAHVDAFAQRVAAYPAITVIRRGPARATAVVTQATGMTLAEVFAAVARHEPNARVEAVDKEVARHEPTRVKAIDKVVARHEPTRVKAIDKVVASREPTTQVKAVDKVACGRDPWLVDSPHIIATIRGIEGRLPTLEQAGAKVGIGVATGADRVYIGEYDQLPVEHARKLKLAVSGDITGNGFTWSGKGLVNPWEPSGKLADLAAYPQFAKYIHKHADRLKKRHTAKKSPHAWYKTIDRVYAELTTTPKLLIPDIKGEASVVYDVGNYYPHHNLYVVTSTTWDLRALQAVLRSSVALMFVAAYCVRMAGGFLRFQAQYLRRIRVPRWESLSTNQRAVLTAAAEEADPAALDRAVFLVFGLSPSEIQTVESFVAGVRQRGVLR